MFNEFYALKHVSFQVNRGEAVALIGRNGSGKSTMLKVIAGVMYPSQGSCQVNGSIAPMIELGAGFDMDLTARENIFLNGAVLGYDREYMNQHFESIIDFSELRDFIDVPVKNFSSGMVARLGFAIATEVKADLLVVDEVLAVGDFMFQQKCMQRLEGMLADGTTLLFRQPRFRRRAPAVQPRHLAGPRQQAGGRPLRRGLHPLRGGHARRGNLIRPALPAFAPRPRAVRANFVTDLKPPVRSSFPGGWFFCGRVCGAFPGRRDSTRRTCGGGAARGMRKKRPGQRWPGR